MSRIRVEFVPAKSNPQAIAANNPEARARNKSAREEIREIFKVIKVGQSFKVWGLGHTKTSNMVYGIMKDVNSRGKKMSIAIRPIDEFIQIWRSE